MTKKQLKRLARDINNARGKKAKEKVIKKWLLWLSNNFNFRAD